MEREPYNWVVPPPGTDKTAHQPTRLVVGLSLCSCDHNNLMEREPYYYWVVVPPPGTNKQPTSQACGFVSV